MARMGVSLASIRHIYPQQHVNGIIHRFILSIPHESASPALLTKHPNPDEMLFAFMVPLLPHIFENRLGLDTSLTQRFTSIFLVEGAFISIISSPFIGDLADRTSSKKTLLLVLLALTLISVLCLSITTSRML